MKIYQAINAVQAALGAEGISKDRKNEQQGYKFRGIDDVYNALSPLLAKHGLCILPRCTERLCVERVNAKGTALFYVTVCCEFDFVSSEDASKHTVTTYGEAMDSGDKATNKAMSAAYKYACMQAFSIPTEGDNDADAQTHQIKASPRHRPVDPVGVSEQRQSIITDVSVAIGDRYEASDIVGAYEEYLGITDAEEKQALWALLPSNIRSAIKRHGDSLKEKTK